MDAVVVGVAALSYGSEHACSETRPEKVKRRVMNKWVRVYNV